MNTFYHMLLLAIGILSTDTAFASDYKFPLAISESKRHLTDKTGKPFLYNADTAWMLFLNLNKEEALEYLITRKSQSFNVIQVILLGFADKENKTPANRYGQRPFLTENNFASPNPEYFRHVKWVIEKADSLGLALSIAPLWAGCCGEGWSGKGKAMELNKPVGNLKFGQYLGKTLGKYKNVLWISGGDNDPITDTENYRQLGLGIKKYAPHQLITYHASSSHSSTDVWAKESWLDLSMIYTYFRGFKEAWSKDQPDVYEVAWKEYKKTPIKPFILGESTYENEHGPTGSALQIRKQAYWALLGGATGHAYGSPLWRCDAQWRNYLDLPGGVSLKHFYTLFTSLRWDQLRPDTNKRLSIEGNGRFAANDYSTTAIAADATFSVSYLPDPRALTIDLNQLKGNSLKAVWYNPVTGEKHRAEKLPHRKIVKLSPPEGYHDWVLIII